jgi:hypothetical protein
MGLFVDTVGVDAYSPRPGCMGCCAQSWMGLEAADDWIQMNAEQRKKIQGSCHYPKGSLKPDR